MSIKLLLNKCGSRGVDRGSGPPLRFVRGGVLCRGLMGRRGGPTVVFTLLLSIFFWLASLASIMQTYFMYTYSQVQCSVWNGHPFSIFPLSKSKRIQLPISRFYERVFSYFSCLELHDFTPFKPKFFLGRTPRPPSMTFTILVSKLPCHPCVCVQRRFQVYENHSIPKINLN